MATDVRKLPDELTVIQTSVELALLGLPPAHPARKHIISIMHAAARIGNYQPMGNDLPEFRRRLATKEVQTTTEV